MKSLLFDKKIAFVLLFVLGLFQTTFAQNESEEIAQKLQNPLSKITAIPVQQNFGFGTSQNDALAYGLSFQPIHASSLKKINIVHRAVLGIAYVPGITGGLALIPQGEPEGNNVDGVWGITDINYSALFAPKNASKLNWGLGPSINLPTASDNRLGSGKWSAGVSGVLVFQTGRWTFDWVVRQTWSFAGEEDRIEVNQMVLQPLVAYGLGKGWMVSTFPTINANWDFPEGQQWTVPLGGGITKVVIAGKLPIALGVQYYYNVVRPDLAPESEFRIQTTFVLSK